VEGADAVIDEGTLRERYPEIPWDQPVLIRIEPYDDLPWWVCRICIALHGLKARDIIQQRKPEFVYRERAHALMHIEKAHHE
jgi:hypothetical protein